MLTQGVTITGNTIYGVRGMARGSSSPIAVFDGYVEPDRGDLQQHPVE